MPLTIAPGRVKASFMKAGKAMANTVEIAGGRGVRPWWIASGTVAALAAIGGPIYAIQVADRRDDIVLTRNAVLQEALGGRTWFGRLANAADDSVADLVVQIRFHDREGRPVGTPVSARAARLAPGDGLHLQARLPAEATGLRVHALRWTGGGRTVERGPGPPLAFGVVQG